LALNVFIVKKNSETDINQSSVRLSL